MRSSVFYTITFFFFVSVVSIFLAFLWLLQYDKQNYTNELNAKYSIVSSATLFHLENSYLDDKLAKQIEGYKMSFVDDDEFKDYILNDAKVIQKITTKKGTSSILKYKKNHYLKITHDDQTYLLKDDGYQPYRYDVIKLIFAGIFFITLISYIITIRRLRPLRNLKNQIEKFAKGDLDEIVYKVKGKDEISEVAAAFQNAVGQIRKLNKSRQLFLRNIMHEIKTPITKGVITTEMLPESKYQERLVKVFEKLESLINEFATIEQITSGIVRDDFKTYRLVDLLDEAIDLSMSEKTDIDVHVTRDINLNVDFKFFCVGLKNMIDNGIKYSSDKHVKITTSNNTLNFISRGEPLKNDLSIYIEPFVQGSNATKSFGLGLYIVHNILKQHNLELDYRYQGGFNIFSFKNLELISESS